ncbi:hypothetical protein F4802DRAFT_576852 [Xylaria palmicola]|nr:hypothetical protein F4802DRAFT_576852 [Xylaria palmicola]
MTEYQHADRLQSPPRRQRACWPCTRAKARCHYENNEIGNGCDRCQRLQTHCIPQTTRSLRRPRQIKTKVALEPVKILSTLDEGGHETVVSGSKAALALRGLPQDPPKENESPDTGRIAQQKHHRIPHHNRSSVPHYLPSSPGFGITWDQAGKAVDDFATIFTAHFPFIILDHDITARRLYVEKPLLFRTILLTAIDLSASKSREIRRGVDAWIGQHLLVLEEQSLGALQGLIVYIAWANPHFYSDSRATQLIYLAVGLAHSLGITRHLPDKQTKKESTINEEHRAFLACYYILSFNSFQFGRPNPLSTGYVEHCVDLLERSSEFSTDFLLIKLVRFRQFIGRIPTIYQGLCEMRWCREISPEASDQLHDMRKELDDFISDVAHKHPKFLLLWALHHGALIQLHLPMTYAIPDSEQSTRLQLECLQHCLRASRTFVSMVKSFSPDGFLYAPFTSLTDILSMLIATSRLLLLDIDGWDLKEARQSIDLRPAMDELIAKLTEAGKIKAERVAAAAAANPSSYVPDGPDEQKQDKLHVYGKLVESMRDWLDEQGVFSPGHELPGRSDTGESGEPPRIHTSSQSPQWNYTYFFESLLKINT